MWVDRCRELFARAEAATRDLALRTGLSCPPGCGACCLSPEVEATVAEMRPMAAALTDSGRAAAVLERLDALARSGDTLCGLYEPDPSDPRRGRCGAYADRPLVCRLYGFAARRDREGRPELLACAVMRAAEPARVERARDSVRDGAPAPRFGDHALAVAADAPGEGTRQVPIDQALRAALEGELLRRRLAGGAGPAAPKRGPDEDPRGPRRAA